MQSPLRLIIFQLLPILVFLAVDAFVEDPTWAIVSALVFVGFQTIIIFKRKKKFDWFILIDAALIGGLGAVSLLSQDELFFKLKPAIIEAVMVPYLLFLALAPTKWLKNYFDRYSMGMELPAFALEMMRKLMIAMALLVLVHAGVTLYAALYWSRQTWGWISGPGFFVMLIPLGAWVLMQKRRMIKRMQQKGAPIRARIRRRPSETGVEPAE